MSEEIRTILTERGKRYGDFSSHARISQRLKRIWVEECSAPYPIETATTKAVIQEGIEMIFHKIARLINGDPTYVDSWVDIAGYAQLVADHLNQVENSKKSEV